MASAGKILQESELPDSFMISSALATSGVLTPSRVSRWPAGNRVESRDLSSEDRDFPREDRDFPREDRDFPGDNRDFPLFWGGG